MLWRAARIIPANRLVVAGRWAGRLAICHAREKHGYSCEGEGKGPSTVVTFSPGGHAVRTDLPKAMGGKDRDPQPVELLLASLVGCEQATATYVARHMNPRIKLEGIDFSYEAERDPIGAQFLPIDAEPPVSPKIERVWGEARVKVRGGDETAERIQTLGRLVHQRCPVAQTLQSAGVNMDGITWVLHRGDP